MNRMRDASLINDLNAYNSYLDVGEAYKERMKKGYRAIIGIAGSLLLYACME